MSSAFEAALGDQLRSAAQRRPRSTWVRVAGVVAAAGVFVTAGLAIVLSPDPALAAVEVTRSGGRIEVILVDLESNPEKVEAELRAEGLDIDVLAVPTGPSQRGRFTDVVASYPDVLNIHDDSLPGRSFVGFSVPEGWQGALDLGLGRLAEPGEGYRAFTDAFAPLEPLTCTGLSGQPLDVVAEAAGRLEVFVQPIDDGVLLDLLSLRVALADGYGRWFVAAGTAQSATRVVVDITPDVPAPMAPDPSC